MDAFNDKQLNEQRWRDEVWKSFELEENLENKTKQKKKKMIVLTSILFVVLSSVPVFLDFWPKWRSIQIGQDIALLLNETKMNAVIQKSAFRFSLSSDFIFKIERVESCKVKQGALIAEGRVLQEAQPKRFQLLTGVQGENLDLPGMVNTFCYDFIRGAELYGGELIAFGIIPTEDIEPKRLDRAAIVFIRGISGQISLN